MCYVLSLSKLNFCFYTNLIDLKGLQLLIFILFSFLLFVLLIQSFLFKSCDNYYINSLLFCNLQVAAIHFLGLAGHFALGNTNSLATIDVAGAFIVKILNRKSFDDYFDGLLVRCSN
jgi:ethanolamine phosphate transferase 2 subunit G